MCIIYREFRLYESYVSGEISKERFLAEKEKMSQEAAGYQEKKRKLQEQIRQAESRKAMEKNGALTHFARYTALEGLSHQIIQELVDVVYFYDPEHIEVLWNFREEYMAVLEEVEKVNVKNRNVG